MKFTSEMIAAIREEINATWDRKASHMFPVDSRFDQSVPFIRLTQATEVRVFKSINDTYSMAVHDDNTKGRSSLLYGSGFTEEEAQEFRLLFNDFTLFQRVKDAVDELLTDIEIGEIDVEQIGFGSEFFGFSVYPNQEEQIMIMMSEAAGFPVKKFNSFQEILNWITEIRVSDSLEEMKTLRDQIETSGKFGSMFEGIMDAAQNRLNEVSDDEWAAGARSFSDAIRDPAEFLRNHPDIGPRSHNFGPRGDTSYSESYRDALRSMFEVNKFGEGISMSATDGDTLVADDQVESSPFQGLTPEETEAALDAMPTAHSEWEPYHLTMVGSVPVGTVITVDIPGEDTLVMKAGYASDDLQHWTMES